MCGIAGEFVFKGDRRLLAPDLFDMIDSLAHRGPESAGYWQSPSCQTVLMHSRLSFVDLEGGAQPLADEDGNLWLALNGELYAHRQSRRELQQRGHRFRSTCDAEIVPHLFQDHGAECFRQLRGEFAFALFDQAHRRLMLVRDRFGIKPLFYAYTEDSIVFGSEMKSLVKHPMVTAQLSRRALRRSLMSLGVPDQSWMKGIKQVKPGHALVISQDGVTEESYWTAEFSPAEQPKTSAEAADRFRRIFDDAVALRLDADVEIGCYLSGGLDSSTLTESMTRQAPYRVKTFSIRYTNSNEDEAVLAADTANRLGADNLQVEIEDGRLADAFMPALWHSEQIAANSHVMAKYLLSEAASREVKAVLTGEGADEMFAGYGFFSHQLLIEEGRSGRNVERQMEDFLSSTRESASLVPVKGYRRYDLVTRLYGNYPYQALRAIVLEAGLKPFLTPDFAAELDLNTALEEHAAFIGRDTLCDLSAVRASQACWIRSELPSYLLTGLGDRPEMANSIEGRLPFLDNSVADFAMSLPVEWLVDLALGKKIVRKAMNGRLPEQVTAPAKQVFWGPPRRELNLLKSDVCRHYLSYTVSRDAGVFRPARLLLLKKSLGLLTRHPRMLSRACGLLIAAASIHALIDLFTGSAGGGVQSSGTIRRRWCKAGLLGQPAQTAAAESLS